MNWVSDGWLIGEVYEWIIIHVYAYKAQRVSCNKPKQ